MGSDVGHQHPRRSSARSLKTPKVKQPELIPSQRFWVTVWKKRLNLSDKVGGIAATRPFCFLESASELRFA